MLVSWHERALVYQHTCMGGLLDRQPGEQLHVNFEEVELSLRAPTTHVCGLDSPEAALAISFPHETDDPFIHDDASNECHISAACGCMIFVLAYLFLKQNFIFVRLHYSCFFMCCFNDCYLCVVASRRHSLSGIVR